MMYTRCGTEAGSYLRLVDSCITQLKAQGPSRTCTESREEEEHSPGLDRFERLAAATFFFSFFFTLVTGP